MRTQCSPNRSPFEVVRNRNRHLEPQNLTYLAHEVGGEKPVGPATSRLGKPVDKLLGQPVHASEVFLRVIGGVGFGGQVIRDITRIWDCGGAVAEEVQSRPVGEPWQVGSGGHHLERLSGEEVPNRPTEEDRPSALTLFSQPNRAGRFH